MSIACIELPISIANLTVLTLVALIGVAIFALFTAFVLNRVQSKNRPITAPQGTSIWPEVYNSRVQRALLALFFIWLAMLILSILSAFTFLFETIFCKSSPQESSIISLLNSLASGSTDALNLGAGALVLGLLGGPFLIWNTFLKHQIAQKEKAQLTYSALQRLDELMTTCVKNLISVSSGNKSTDLEPSRASKFLQNTLSLMRLEHASDVSVTLHDGAHHIQAMRILCAFMNQELAIGNPSTHRDDLQFCWDLLRRRSLSSSLTANRDETSLPPSNKDGGENPCKKIEILGKDSPKLSTEEKYKFTFHFRGIEISKSDIYGIKFHSVKFEKCNFDSAQSCIEDTFPKNWEFDRCTYPKESQQECEQNNGNPDKEIAPATSTEQRNPGCKIGRKILQWRTSSK